MVLFPQPQMTEHGFYDVGIMYQTDDSHPMSELDTPGTLAWFIVGVQ